MTWFERDLVGVEPVWVRLDLVHLQPLAPDRDVRHAGNPAAAAPGCSSRRSSTCRSATCVSEDIPIFMVRLVDDNGWIMTGGAAQRGRLGVTQADALRDQLTGPQQVGAPVEAQLDLRQVRRPTWSA